MSDSADVVARAFLADLDGRRWRDAAALVDPETRKRFRAFAIEWIERRDPAPQQRPATTHFASPAALLGVADGASAMAMDAEELLARFAEGIHPGNLDRHHRSSPKADSDVRITRTLLDVQPRGDGRAWARYRTEWWHAGVRNEATAGEHRMELIRTSGGWRVRDADLGGWGGGHILPPG